MIIPAALQRGDGIAIISPATIVAGEYVDAAASLLRDEGYRVEVMPGAKGPADGSFASSEQQRQADLTEALLRKDIKAILCARGGYGCIHLLPHFEQPMLAENAKWIAGFSDVSALHAMMHSAGVASLHSPMAKHMATLGRADEYTRRLLAALGPWQEIECSAAPDARNICGTARGELRGGNLAVLNSLADTPYDILHIGDGERVILFIEDIAEKIYAVERMLIRLILGGNIGRLSGLIIGRFTEYTADRNHPTMEDMISRLLSRYDIRIPTAFGFPVGHVDENVTLVEGAQAELTVAPEGVCLTMKRE